MMRKKKKKPEKKNDSFKVGKDPNLILMSEVMILLKYIRTGMATVLLQSARKNSAARIYPGLCEESMCLSLPWRATTSAARGMPGDGRTSNSRTRGPVTPHHLLPPRV